MNVKKKQGIRRRAGRCEICLSPNRKLTIDHIIPRALGGTNSRRNLRALCRRCHDQVTSEFTEQFGDVVGLFKWARVVGRVVDGRLSEERAMIVRAGALMAMGWHPKETLDLTSMVPHRPTQRVCLKRPKGR